MGNTAGRTLLQEETEKWGVERNAITFEHRAELKQKNMGERGFLVWNIASPIHNNGSSLNIRYSIKPERVDCYPRFKKLQMTWFYGKKGVE